MTYFRELNMPVSKPRGSHKSNQSKRLPAAKKPVPVKIDSSAKRCHPNWKPGEKKVARISVTTSATEVVIRRHRVFGQPKIQGQASRTRTETKWYVAVLERMPSGRFMVVGNHPPGYGDKRVDAGLRQRLATFLGMDVPARPPKVLSEFVDGLKTG